MVGAGGVDPKRKPQTEFAKWNTALDGFQKPTNAPVPTYAQVVGAVNAKAGEHDLLIAAAGGLPGEVMKNWRVKAPNTFDCEFGFSCMGYEISAGWGAAMADPSRTPIVMIGDGTYMMMNSDIYSSVLSGHKIILIVCDNGGYAVINRLQNAKGGASFNNLLKDCRVKQSFSVDFAKHAEAMGALTRRVDSLAELGQAMDWAKTTDRTTLITIVSDAFTWTPGDAWWDVGVPATSERKAVREDTITCRTQAPTRRGLIDTHHQLDTSCPWERSVPFSIRIRAEFGEPNESKTWHRANCLVERRSASAERRRLSRRCLRQAREAGFTGMETGRRFPMDPTELTPVLHKHGMSVCGGWFSGLLLDGDLQAEKERVAGQMALFKAVGAPCIVYGETAGTIQGDQSAPLVDQAALSARMRSRPMAARSQPLPNGAQRRECRSATITTWPRRSRPRRSSIS